MQLNIWKGGLCNERKGKGAEMKKKLLKGETSVTKFTEILFKVTELHRDTTMLWSETGKLNEMIKEYDRFLMQGCKNKRREQ